MKNPFSTRSEMGIRKRVFLLLIVVFVPLLLLEAFIYFQWFQERKETEVQANLELARAAAKNFETFLQGLIGNELAVGLALTASQPMTERDRDGLLDTFKAHNPEVRSIFFMNPEGAVIASSLRSYIGFDLSDRSFFQKVKHGQEWAVSELILGRATGKPAFTVSRGIRNENGDLLGVVAASIEPDRLEGVLGIPRSGDAGVSLIDNKGMHVFRYPPTTYTWEQRNWLKLYPILAEVLKGTEIANASHVSKLRSGTKRIVAFTPIASIGWVASCSRAESEVMADITGTLLPQALLVLLVTLAAFGAAVGLSRPITGSILKLINHVAAIGRGETENLVPISGPEELKDLAVAFNQMAGDVRSREASLRQSEQRWATTLASIGDAVIVTDINARIAFMNPVAEGLTGWTLRQASQKFVTEVFNIINEQTRKAVDDPVARVLREGNIIGLANHTVLIRKDGTQVAIDDSGAPIKDPSGNILGVILVFRDITERRRAEETLRETEEKYRELVRLAPTAIYEIDFRSQRFTSVNEAMCAMTGYRREELLAMNPFGLLDEEGRALFRSRMGKWLKGEEPDRNVEFRIRAKDGHVLYVVLDVTFTRDEEGKPLGATVIAHEITERKQAEEELREAHDRALWLARFPDENPNPVMRVSGDGSVLYSNPSALELPGWTGDTGQPLDYRLMPVVGRAMAEGQEEQEDVQIGRLLYSVWVAPFPEEGYANVYGRDITERKRAEDALRESEERFRLALRNAPVSVAAQDRDLRYIWAYNQRTAKPDQILGHFDHEIFTPEETARITAIKRRVLHEGVEHREQMWLDRPSGRIFLDISWEPIRDGAGRVTGVASATVDLTPIKLAEEALERTRNTLAEAQKIAHLGSFEYVGATRTTVWSEEEYRIYGLDPARPSPAYDDMLAKCIHPDDVTLLHETFTKAMQSRSIYEMEHRIVRPDGTVRWVYDRAHPYFDEKGNLLRYVGVTQDITERKRMEEELRKSRDALELRVKDRTAELERANTNLKRANKRLEELNKELQDFAFVASHDLQEPLRKVRAFGDLLAAKPDISADETSRDYISRMQSAASRMQSLLNSLLSYSRVTTKAEPTEETDLGKSVEETLSNLEILIKEKVARVEVGNLPTVKADGVQMVQLFQNLVGNALKYHRAGQAPSVKVYARVGTGGSKFEICVEDNGIGFEEKYLDRIFLPFQRLHGRSSGYEGVGMGLAICKKIVERHGGEITARSEPGKGSTFIVTLPAEGKVG